MAGAFGRLLKRLESPSRLLLIGMGFIAVKPQGSEEIDMKRIVICADGTWNRPEKDLEKDQPTNVLKLAQKH